MKHLKLLALPALLLGLYAQPMFAADAAPAASAVSMPKIAVEQYKLANGLNVVLVPNKKLPAVAVNIWYHVGPANEEPGLTGFAHLFEHMMFAGSKHIPRGEADKMIESVGGSDSNGSTDFDRTNYYDTVPANQLELALWIHADRMGYLLDVLDQTALSNQQDVVRNERRQRIENRPYGIVEEGLFHQLFPKEHPYYASVMGSHADIQNAKLGDVRKFFNNYYSPNNASLVIAGDFDNKQTKALVEKYFGSLKRGPDVPKITAVTPPIKTERRAVIQDKVELPRVFMGWLTSPSYTPGDAELSIAAQILAGSKSSRLYKSLVYEKQIAQDVNAYQASNALTSMFVIDVTARPGHTAQEIEAAIDAELKLLREDGPSEKEIERARNSIQTAMLTQIETSQGLANQVNQYVQYLGDPNYLEKDLQRLTKPDAAAVKAAVTAQLTKDSRAVVHGVPGKPDFGAEVPTPEIAKNAKSETTSSNPEQAWRAKRPKAGAEPKLVLPKAETFTLANGLTVIYHRNPSLPLVAAELVIKSGSANNPLGKAGLAAFTTKLLEEGSAKRTALQIADDVAQLGATLETGSTQSASFVNIYSLKSNFGKALEIVADIAQHPAFPTAEIERQRASRLGELTQEREKPNAVSARVSRLALFGEQHPAAYTSLGTESALKAFSQQDVQEFWSKNFLPNNAALIISGDVNSDELKALVQAQFGEWKAGAKVVDASATPKTTDAKVVIVDKPGAPQTALSVVALGPVRKTADFEALQVMNAALGGLFTSRITNNLREDKGYTYGTHANFAYGRNFGQYSLTGGIRTDVTAPAVSEILKEVKGMIAKPMPAAELQGAKNSQVLTLPATFATNSAIGASLSNLFIYDLGVDYFSTLPKRFSGVTAKKAQDVAAKYLAPKNLLIVAVGDKAKIAPELTKLNLGKIEERDAEGKVLAK
ncbi:MAG: insulinase family protein [Burkholderiales bacterium]|nr:insulinase family protein [Burkholderiales bacterium]